MTSPFSRIRCTTGKPSRAESETGRERSLSGIFSDGVVRALGEEAKALVKEQLHAYLQQRQPSQSQFFQQCLGRLRRVVGGLPGSTEDGEPIKDAEFTIIDEDDK